MIWLHSGLALQVTILDNGALTQTKRLNQTTCLTNKSAVNATLSYHIFYFIMMKAITYSMIHRGKYKHLLLACYSSTHSKGYQGT